MSLTTIKANLTGATSEPGIKANAAFHLLMVLEHLESGHIGKMEALTKVRKCSNAHTGSTVDSNDVRKFCADILKHI